MNKKLFFLLSTLLLVGHFHLGLLANESNNEYVIEENRSLLGIWSGSIPIGSLQLPLTFHVLLDIDGEMTAQFSCFDQGIRDLPVEIVCENSSVKFVIQDLSATYEGFLNQEGKLEGYLYHKRGTFLLVLEKAEMQIFSN